MFQNTYNHNLRSNTPPKNQENLTTVWGVNPYGLPDRKISRLFFTSGNGQRESPLKDPSPPDKVSIKKISLSPPTPKIISAAVKSNHANCKELFLALRLSEVFRTISSLSNKCCNLTLPQHCKFTWLASRSYRCSTKLKFDAVS